MTEDIGKQWTELYQKNTNQEKPPMPSEPLPFVDERDHELC
ncbi:hypothetical protein J2754_003060 [Halarchaeum solikamskense]|nr:hypothetical protein [Halarchaeum solikamskense]